MLTLTISCLDDSEADHIAEILKNYKTDIMMLKLNALANKDEALEKWYESHLMWYEKIMNKVKWKKE